MKRFTATWTMALASAVLLAVPATGAAQTPPSPTQPSTPASATAQQGDATDNNTAAHEHLRKANSALADVKTATLPARAKSEIAEIKRRISALERTASATDKASATGQANRTANPKAAADWGNEVAAIDKALTALLGPEHATPGPIGTSGTTPTMENKAAAAITLGAEARASLVEVRKHLTAFATAMAGGKTSIDTAAPTSSSSASSATPTTDPAASTAASGTTPAQSQAQTTQPPAQIDPTAAAQSTASGAQSQADEEAARQHLTAARNTLSALTQLPAASQLTGESRTQVAQLISNFNELITTQSQWRDSYSKVNANLTALLGPDPTATDPTNASGTAGAVGTSGAAPATIDPAVRERLVELRRNLTAFEKAASGGSTTASSTTGTGAASTGAATTATAGTGAASTSSTDPVGSSPAMKPTPTTPATDPAQSTGTAGTAGTTGQGAASSNADVMRHVAAIEAMLKMQDDSGGLTLTKAQVEQLRTHWAALRSAIEKK